MLRQTCAALVLVGVFACMAPVRAAHAALSGATFVVDPGHGTRYPSGAPLNVGAVGPDGVGEAAVALAVGEGLALLLRGAGARVVMTRTPQKPYRTATDKRKDNRARAALANTLGATAFIAVHADSSLDRNAHGISVFWLRPNSLRLAEAVRDNLRPLALGLSQFRTRNLAVTDEARVPAVLIELGFVSNPLQEHLLATPSFQQREARALFAAIVDVYGS
jgi:N-acetylmuramoyl-L-alanine amidase